MAKMATLVQNCQRLCKNLNVITRGKVSIYLYQYTSSIIIIIIIINLYMKLYHFYMVFVCKIRLKYSKELFDYKVKNTKTHIIIVKISHGVLR